MLKVHRFVAAFVAVGALFGSVVTATAQDKLDRALREGKRAGQSQHVILKARAGYAGWLRQSLLNSGNLIDADLPSIGALATELTPQQLDVYCSSRMVEGCSVDAEVSAHAAPARMRALRSAGPAVNTMLETLGLVPSTAGGAGVTVALIDSGLFPSEAFSGRIKAFYDFTNGKQQLKKKAYDDYGHGTHVAGLIGAAESQQDQIYQGVAPGVEFVVLKVLDAQGRGKTSDVMRAIAFAAANTDRSGSPLGIDIINLSLGHPIFEPAATDPLVQAVDAATLMGAIVVASAGNFGVNPRTGEIGYGGITSPGNARSAITVGAADHKATVTRVDDRVTAYSSRGPTWYDGYAKPDVVAPGHYLTSESSPTSGLFLAYPSLRNKAGPGKAFLTLSGTSMAAGVTTGVVALLKAQQPRLTANLAKALLQYTALPLSDDAGQRYNVLTQGTGEINAAGAMLLLASIDPSLGEGQPVPTVWTDLQ
ncbi:MAG: S8 family peptidase, partial [Vicinamibacterales bacterium]